MNENTAILEIYIDTNALRGMSFNKEIAHLLGIVNARCVSLYISETTLWERGRQQYEKDFEGDRVVPFPDGINRYLAWFKALFENHGVIIIKSTDAITAKAMLHLQNNNTYFSKDNSNDQRDAHVLATAECSLDKNCIILCNDTKLAKSFENEGFSNTRRDYKDFVSGLFSKIEIIPAIVKPSLDSLDDYQISTTFTQSFHSFIMKADNRFHTYLLTLPSITDKLSAKLTNMQVLDMEIRKRVLGYIQWFAPIVKKDLHKLLKSKHYGVEQIDSNAQRLKQEQLLIETEHHWLTNTKTVESREICEQAMALVMPEILEIMELS
jgi:hypothetical protein